MSETETALHDEQERLIDFEFHGKEFEYFKIWIVNIALTILTLGIYSAWAKVRNNRYFYSNLHLDGQPFEYLADPITILKGRLIAVTVFIAYVLLSELFPVAGVFLALGLLIISPWLIVRSLMFSCRMSAYRNVQFRFHGKPGEAAVALYVWPILGVLTFGILYPLALLKLNKYIVENSAYGTAKFEFHATYGDYGRVFLVMIGTMFLAAILAGVTTGIVGNDLPEETRGLPGLVVALPLYFVAIVYMNVKLFNIYYLRASLRSHGFDADAEIGAYAWVMITNIVLIVLTLGLFLPAAKIRMTRYLTSSVAFVAIGSLDNFAAAERESVDALGEELGEIFDFDIGVT